MKVKEVLTSLLKFHPDCEISVVVHNKLEEFTITSGGSDGCQPDDKDTTVGFYVDRLNGNEQG